MPYITSTEFKATNTLTGTTYADADITRALAAATESINSYCGQSFPVAPATEVPMAT